MDAYRIPSRNRLSAGPEKIPAVIAICAASVVVWLVLLATQNGRPFWENALGGWMAIRTGRFDLRNLLAYHLLHQNWVHLLVNLAFVASVGRPLELRWGSLRFFAFYLASAIACGLTVYGVDLLLRSATGPAAGGPWISFGASGAALACAAAYVVTAEDRPVISFFTERYLLWSAMLVGAGLLVLLERLSRIPGREQVLLVPQLSGIAFGMAFSYPVARWARARARPARRARPRHEVAEIRARVDQLLEKISRQGMASLSAPERRFLRAASKHFRNSR